MITDCIMPHMKVLKKQDMECKYAVSLLLSHIMCLRNVVDKEKKFCDIAFLQNAVGT